ncbi:unnamed protein product [Bursaphelenchus xylophilus]|uniref:(pine wood nematode) hypothetical protein n=1 Tax=Bursaphelenchus xylophilus TaxID=6326 RepID=A0A7I8XBW7_BURXY|nr:unnamed protein product [Bursaphelenchus xylophilus]CAG9083866.1 unnamed protein product [Bursaphelenchus xylophilus]
MCHIPFLYDFFQPVDADRMSDDALAADWRTSQSFPRQSSLKVNHYVLLSNLHPDSDDRRAQWRETAELPENCVGSSSWVINDLAQPPPRPPLVRQRSSDWDHMRFNRVKTKSSETWPTGLDKHGPEHSLDADARKHLWSISPTAFHQSFDDRLKGCEEAVLSNSCSNIEEQVRRNHGRRTRRAAFCSGDSSKGPMAASYGFSGNDGLSSGGNRPPNLGGRSPQSSFDSNGDVGQVTLNLMRVNGTMPGFKTLLASSNSPGTLQRNLQGQARDSLAKINTGAPTTTPQVICGEFVKRKESLGRPRKESDAIRILSENVVCNQTRQPRDLYSNSGIIMKPARPQSQVVLATAPHCEGYPNPASEK